MFKRITFIIVLIVFGSVSLFAQLPINITAGLSGGLLIPQSSDIKGSINSVYDYPLGKSSYAIGGKVRVGLLAIPISFIGHVTYNALSGNSTIKISGIDSKYSLSLKVVSVGVGAEYNLLPLPIVKPYISGSLDMNFFSGNSKYDNDLISETNLNSTNRMGLALGIGSLIEIPFFPVSFDIEAKYNFANLTGKEFSNNDASFNGFGGIPQSSSYNLNDAANPNDSKDHNRSINFLTLMLSVNFNIL